MALTDNLQGWWKFDESSGNAADSSGNGRTLTNVSSTGYVSGKIGNAIDIVPASGDQFWRTSVANSTWASIGGDFTVQAWIFPDASHGAEGTAIAAHFNGEVVGDWLFAWGAQHLRAYHRPTAGTWIVGETGTTISLSAWHHVVMRRSSGTVTVWVDGSSHSLGSFVGGPGGWGSSGFVVGTYSAGDASYTFDGQIDMLGLWDRAISDSEIGELYASGSGLDYPFSGGGGPTAFPTHYYQQQLAA